MMRTRKLGGVLLGLAVTASLPAATEAEIAGGLLTADVALSVPGINGGQAFPAVINPDNYRFMGDLDNDSGVLTGDYNDPDTFSYTDLPIYTPVPWEADVIVPFPAPFTPWDYATRLFDELDREEREFSLALVGTLIFTAYKQESPYDVPAATFHDVVNDATYNLSGSVDFGTPPSGYPSYFYYSVDGISLQEVTLLNNAVLTSIQQSNDPWGSNGWPGVVADKNLFPVPEPAAALLVILGGMMVCVSRRRHRG